MARTDWKQSVSVTLSKRILRILREQATKQKVSRSHLVERAVYYTYFTNPPNLAETPEEPDCLREIAEFIETETRLKRGR